MFSLLSLDLAVSQLVDPVATGFLTMLRCVFDRKKCLFSGCRVFQVSEHMQDDQQAKLSRDQDIHTLQSRSKFFSAEQNAEQSCKRPQETTASSTGKKKKDEVSVELFF